MSIEKRKMALKLAPPAPREKCYDHMIQQSESGVKTKRKRKRKTSGLKAKESSKEKLTRHEKCGILQIVGRTNDSRSVDMSFAPENLTSCKAHVLFMANAKM